MRLRVGCGNQAKKDHYMEAMDAVGAVVPHTDFSIWGLFWAADWIVKSVMLGLLGASVWCWAIIIDKTITYRRTNAEMNRFERTFWSGQSLEELYQMQSEKPSGGMGAVFVAAMKEWKRSHEQNAASFLGMQQRLRARATIWRSGWAFWPRSARPARSSACSAPSGAL